MEKEALALKLKLQEMAVMYGRFHELLLAEQGYLVSNSTRELAETVKEKERMAERIQSAEEERLAVMVRIAGMTGADPLSLRVDDVAARLGKEEADDLKNARLALKTVVAQVRALNEVNNQLLADSMEYVRGAFEFVAGKQDVRQGYGKGGQFRTAVNVKRNLVNTRA